MGAGHIVKDLTAYSNQREPLSARLAAIGELDRGRRPLHYPCGAPPSQPTAFTAWRKLDVFVAGREPSCGGDCVDDGRWEYDGGKPLICLVYAHQIR